MAPRWSRRRLLRNAAGSVAFSLAGCVGSVVRLSGCETPSPTDQSTPGSPGDGFPAVSVSGDPPPLEHDVHIDVRVRRQFTAESPAELAVSFTNAARRARRFQFGPVVPFTPGEVEREGGNAELELVPIGEHKGTEDREFDPESYVPPEPVDGCWQAEHDLVFVDYFDSVRLAPCESVSQTYAILDHWDADGCLPAGTYRADAEWWIGDVDNGKSWGFDLTIGDE